LEGSERAAETIVIVVVVVAVAVLLLVVLVVHSVIGYGSKASGGHVYTWNFEMNEGEGDLLFTQTFWVHPKIKIRHHHHHQKQQPLRHHHLRQKQQQQQHYSHSINTNT